MDGGDITKPRSDAQKRASFFGSYPYSVDAKGRIIIPTVYRTGLGDSFTIGPTRDFRGIALYPDEVFEAIMEELGSMNQRKPVVQKYSMQFFKLSYRDMQPDAQGRVLLPAKIRQRMLGEARDLEVSGARDHVRIVDAVKAQAEDESFMADIDMTLEQMGDMDDR